MDCFNIEKIEKKTIFFFNFDAQSIEIIDFWVTRDKKKEKENE